jgi:hypothetical protein
MTFSGHIENGLVVFDAAPGLPDGTPVVVSVIEKTATEKAATDKTVTEKTKPAPAKDGEREIPTLYERMKPIIGIAEHLPPDASSKIDEVLYGRGDQ